MKIVDCPAELRRTLAKVRGQKRIAFVPTMGCLHAGHMKLIEKAKALADMVVVSIYVNPTQFAANEDLATYPRPFEQDKEHCKKAGVDVLFHPQNLYPRDGGLVTLDLRGLDETLCGASRPGHFNGVLTVVNKLFNIVQPNMAVFGEKDWQQLVIIRRMVSDLYMPVDIVAVETMREVDGLALSSRNHYLTPKERTQAVSINQTLCAVQKMANEGEHDVATLLKSAQWMLEHAGIYLDYLEIRDAHHLQPLQQLTVGIAARIFVAAYLGDTRLIDNMLLSTEDA